jgi:hypothetical protein
LAGEAVRQADGDLRLRHDVVPEWSAADRQISETTEKACWSVMIAANRGDDGAPEMRTTLALKPAKWC